jgi:hypothetical protein
MGRRPTTGTDGKQSTTQTTAGRAQGDPHPALGPSGLRIAGPRPAAAEVGIAPVPFGRGLAPPTPVVRRQPASAEVSEAWAALLVTLTAAVLDELKRPETGP